MFGISNYHTLPHLDPKHNICSLVNLTEPIKDSELDNVPMREDTNVTNWFYFDGTVYRSLPERNVIYCGGICGWNDRALYLLKDDIDYYCKQDLDGGYLWNFSPAVSDKYTTVISFDETKWEEESIRKLHCLKLRSGVYQNLIWRE